MSIVCDDCVNFVGRCEQVFHGFDNPVLNLLARDSHVIVAANPRAKPVGGGLKSTVVRILDGHNSGRRRVGQHA